MFTNTSKPVSRHWLAARRDSLAEDNKHDELPIPVKMKNVILPSIGKIATSVPKPATRLLSILLKLYVNFK